MKHAVHQSLSIAQGREMLQKVCALFLLVYLVHCFVCGRKGHYVEGKDMSDECSWKKHNLRKKMATELKN